MSISVVVAACATEATAQAPQLPATRTATISEIVRVVEAQASPDEAYAQVSDGLALGAGAQIRTGDNSKARLEFNEGTIVRLSQNTQFTIQVLSPHDGEPLTRLRLEAGKIWVTLLGGTMEVETPVGVASVRGSFAIFEYAPGDPFDPNDDVLLIDCIEGLCGALNDELNESFGILDRLVLSNGGLQADYFPLSDADVEQFILNNPDVGPMLSATLTAAPTRPVNPQPSAVGSESSPTLEPATATRRASTPVTSATSPLPGIIDFFGTLMAPRPGVASTPTPTCVPPEFFDPFLNRCRLPDSSPQPDTNPQPQASPTKAGRATSPFQEIP